MIQYNYNKFIDESVEEWYAILGYKYISISYYKDMDNGESDYTEFSIDLPISDKLDVSARYGKLADGEDYQQLTIFRSLPKISMTVGLEVAFNDTLDDSDRIALILGYRF